MKEVANQIIDAVQRVSPTAIPIHAMLIAALAFMAIPVHSQAQDRMPVSFDVRGAYGFPMGDFSDNVEGDFGFGVGAVLNLTPIFGVYGGWAQDAFGCDSGLCDSEDQVKVSGFEIGGKVMAPRWQGGALPWLKVGLIAQRAQFDAGAIEVETERDWGFQGAIGVDFPLGEVISVTPSLRYNRLNFDENENFFDQPDVHYLSFDIGAHIHIPTN